MRHVFLLSVLHLVVSCGGSPTASSTAGPPVYGCRENGAARAACAAKGAAFRYQADPPRNCSGHPDAKVEHQAPDAPCVCIETTEVDRLFKECSEAN